MSEVPESPLPVRHTVTLDHEVYDPGENEIVEWWAYCTCGWQGPMRDGFGEAERDGREHA